MTDAGLRVAQGLVFTGEISMDQNIVIEPAIYQNFERLDSLTMAPQFA